MKIPKEFRQLINRLRRGSSKPNGVVRYLYDKTDLERKLGTNKRAHDGQ